MNAQQALQEHFGFAAFRGMQGQVVEHVLAGADGLVIMATGEGKSLCYQLPAMMQDGLTLVISPLIALMEDQVLALQNKGLPAACIHSMLERHEREERLAAAVDGKIKLLYVTPERFRVDSFREQIGNLKVALLAVDEAHCVSHWGHDFRPDYGRLGEAREAIGNPPTLALTATATPEVQKDILTVLRMPEAQLFHSGIDRPNLFCSVRQVDDQNAKLERILEVVDDIGGPGIVYCALIRDLHELEGQLQRRGYQPIVYHGKLSASERKQQQERFVQSKDGLILATNAFGMGVDKADIRFILHYQLPGTLEAYYQEIGRAGRDGLGSFCELLYFEEDVSIQRNFTEWANPSQTFMLQVVQHLASMGDRLNSIDADDLRDTFLIKNRGDGRVETCLNLLRTAGCFDGELGRDMVWLRTPDMDEIVEWLPDDKRERNLMGLLRMVEYAKLDGDAEAPCRKAYLHSYFGFNDVERCGACDLCTPAESVLAKTLPKDQRRPIPRNQAAPQPAGKAPVQRGDWINVRGHGLCAVKRVHQRGNNTRVDVERARDLTEHSFDLKRVRWKKVD